MPAIAQFLLSITGSVAARVLTSLGFGFISYAALSTLTSNLISLAQDQYNLIDADLLQFLNLGGFSTAMGITASALTTRAALMAIKRLRPLS